MRGRRHSDETRAAVMAALLAGQGVRAIAAQYHLEPSLVSKWRKKIPCQVLTQLDTKRTHDLSNLIEKALTETWKFQAFYLRFLRSAQGLAWIKKYSPSEFAVLYGVTNDKAVRIHEAERRAEQIALEESSEHTDNVQESIH